MSQFEDYKYACPHCGKPSKIRIEILNTAETFVVDKIDVNTGGLVVSKHRYVHKPNAELLDDALYCDSCGELVLNERNNQAQWADVLEELAANYGNEFENTPSLYFVDRVNGVSDWSRIEHCDKLATILKAALPYLEKIGKTSPNFLLEKRAQTALVQAGYLKSESAA